MGDLTDEQLMERFCTGDESAFDVLYDRHARSVQAFLRRMVRDPALSEDLLQTTFLSVFRSRDRYEKRAPVLQWFLAIAANAARDALRRQKTHEVLATDDESPALEPSVDPVLRDPGLARQIEAAFDTLPPQQREAVVLHKVQGLSFEAIAEALGTSVNAAKVRAHRGYEKLKAALAHLEDG